MITPQIRLIFIFQQFYGIINSAMAEIKRETDFIPEEFWNELLPICHKYLGSKGEAILNETLEILGKDRNNVTFGDLTDIYNALISKLIYLDKRADFRMELYDLRRKYMVPPEAIEYKPSKLELFFNRLFAKRSSTILIVAIIIAIGIGLYYGLRPKSSSGVISGKYDVVLWSGIYSKNMEKTISEIIEKFNEQYRPYKSRLDLLPGSGDPMAEMGTQMKIMAVFAAGEPPDIIYGTQNPIYINAPYLLKIPKEQIMQLHYFPQILNQITSDGEHFYCYPAMITPKFILIANRTLIEGLGYNPQKIQEVGIDWDSFIDLANKLKLVSPYPVLISLRGGSLFDIFWMLMVNNGVGKAIGDNRFLWDETKIEETLKFFDKLVKSGIINPTLLGSKLSTNIDIFNEGKAGILIGNYLDYKMIDNAKKVKSIILPFPNNQGSKISSLWEIYGYFCFRQRDNYNPDKAQMTLLLAKTLAQNSNWVLDIGGLPASRNIWDNLNLNKEENHSFLYNYVENAVPTDNDPLFTQIAFEAINPQLENIVTGKVDTRQALEAIKDRLDKILSQSRR
ncbi:carbohydrate ABC transporter substrate-binding protein [bacterium]|nr:carbohydrate ABC transporter substrate-binding protein [bacterium]